MVAVNAEKILHATDDSRALINRNMGYPDGIGAVWALRKKGAKQSLKFRVVSLAGCYSKYYKTKSFY